MSLVVKVLRQIHVRPRLTTSTLVGAGVLFLLPGVVSGPTRALLAWDVGGGLYLALAWTMMLRENMEKMRSRAMRQDDGAAAVLALTVFAAVASLAAILLELIGLKGYPASRQSLHLALAAGTILCSWCIVHTSFALHYAHEYYVALSRSERRCLAFPGNDQPDYADFLYFSFVIGTTSQTADVTIASGAMRRLALVHGVIAFFFNTTLLALSVNIAAGLSS